MYSVSLQQRTDFYFSFLVRKKQYKPCLNNEEAFTLKAVLLNYGSTLGALAKPFLTVAGLSVRAEAAS